MQVDNLHLRGERRARRAETGPAVAGVKLNRQAAVAMDGTAGVKKAGEGTRTLDIQLGKLALYQLSYARKTPGL